MVDLSGVQRTLGASYTVERELGGGGMSRVFVVFDTQLGRRVVVKVLPAELAASVSMERFRREISLAASLQHPHIVGVLSAGEMDGMPYFTMPFVEGESLRARIEREGPLTVGRTVSILKDVARALAYAHERGVVHRDIKPDNVLLAGTSATVTDFGIAKAILGAVHTDPGTPSGAHAPRTRSALTQLGTTLGTPAYMAPEQAAADPNTDHRADLYAFGIMAYEMLTGRVPFNSRTPQQLLAAHLTATPEPIAAKRADVPIALAQLIMQCLEKDPARRPQAAREIAERLEHPDMVSGAFASASHLASRPRRAAPLVVAGVGAVALGVVLGAWFITDRAESRRADSVMAARAEAQAAAERERSIAVLPFVNIGRDSTDDYLADGLTNDLINVLSKVRGVRVTSRSVASSARGRFGTPGEIGEALNVGRLLEGTVQREGTRLRVTARVTNTDDGFTVWADMFERELSDIFAVQDEISQAIADALGAQMSAAISARAERGTADDVAYDLYLRGQHFFALRGEAALRRALDLFRQATQRDPDFARAHAGIASVLSVLPLYTPASADSLFAPGFAAATRAIELDSSLAEAYASRATLLMGRWRWTEAEQDLRRATTLDPRSPLAHQWYGELLMLLRRLPESLRMLERAVQLDPISPVAGSSHAMALTLAGNDTAAVREARRAVALDSTLFLPRMVLGLAHVVANRLPQGIRELESALALSGRTPHVRAVLGFAYARAGQAGRAQLMGDELRAMGTSDSRAALSIVEGALGDTTAAMASLERAAREHALFLTQLPLWVFLFDPVRAHPDFPGVQERLNLR